MNNQKLEIRNSFDENNNPAGGYVKGVGLNINWQDGPLGRDGDRKEPNGSFVETVVRAAKQRIEFYESTKFSCDENKAAIQHLKKALECMEARTQKREDRKVEGTHEA